MTLTSEWLLEIGAAQVFELENWTMLFDGISKFTKMCHGRVWPEGLELVGGADQGRRTSGWNEQL